MKHIASWQLLGATSLFALFLCLGPLSNEPHHPRFIRQGVGTVILVLYLCLFFTAHRPTYDQRSLKLQLSYGALAALALCSLWVAPSPERYIAAAVIGAVTSLTLSMLLNSRHE
jgi:hypothetical protein